MSDAWIANLSDGSTVVEDWVAGYLSPWQRLMDKCSNEHIYITNLRLTVGNRTVGCEPNAVGYWQAHGMPASQGVESDEELHTWRGIGWVVGETVKVLWMARDPRTHHVISWRDEKEANTQGQIIWSKPSLVLQP